MDKNCPHCDVSLIGDPIPEEQIEFFSGRTHWMRQIGIYDRDTDRMTAWRCPDCGHEW